MPGWNGAGIYDLRYTFVNDALAGIKILASRQDAMWNDLKTGLQNCLTLDGQTVPTANIGFGGFRLTDIAAGVDSTDAARMDQIVSSEWLEEAASPTWINATSFKLLAIDRTSRYTPGLRIKFLDNSNQRYGTVLEATFSTDTTITVLVDGGTALVGPTTELYYALLATVNPSEPINSLYTQLGSTAIASSSTTILSSGTFAEFDALSEGSAGRLTAKRAGTYSLEVSGFFLSSTANVTLGSSFTLAPYKNAVAGGACGGLDWPFASGVSNHMVPISGLAVVSGIVAGDVLDMRLTSPSFSAGSGAFQGGLRIARLG